ncbi:hypothetical protein [Polyangium jinanense]|uniref:Calcineurin-like phosphoesterase domain-containing protein n=1 Tax=Polyangium jinanense TaxID=2829994 RepID=A0A9X3X4B6_9BACT|nr:hypothetical protein [Polyangium jinanense]MDC3958308.1 hypothetical protein [Polyangium jinanense]MDC3983357.1 hypothetical protein [Polyangium jinanense]
MHHTLVISDIHLCEVEPGTGPWMRHRQRAFLPDGEIAGMLEAVLHAVRGQRMTLVLNGDVFDFDAPRVIDGRSACHDLPRDAEHGVPAIAAILNDHPIVLEALGRVLDEGHDIVIVSGNHDVLLTLPEVRAHLAARLCDAACALRARDRSPSARAAIAARIHFRAWMHVTPDRVVIEHGHLYDPYCSYRYPMAPYDDGGREIVATMGSMGTRLLVSRLGYFNPHDDSSVMMTKLGYLLHWARYYLFSRRWLALIWAFGTARILARLWRSRRPFCRARYRGNVLACARETGERVAAVARHARLFEPPAESRFLRVVRELWVDHVFVILVGAALGALFISAVGMPLGLLGGIVPLLVFMLYDRLVPKPPLAETWLRVGRVMRNVAKIHGARAVVFGHTHNPEGSWEGDVFIGNSGSWSAAMDGPDGTPRFGEHPFVWLTSDEQGAITGGLYAWKDSAIVPRVVRDPQTEAPPHSEALLRSAEAPELPRDDARAV